MSDQSAILAKLTELAAPNSAFKDGHRVISQGLPPLVAIIREIDDTVLERTLVFSFGSVSVSAVVAGRRLRGIIEISGGVPDAPEVVGQILSRDAPEMTRAVGDFLGRVFTDDATVTVQSTAFRPLGSSTEAGVGIRTLTQEWDVDLATKADSPLSRFLTANSAVITDSYHVTNGQPPETTGDVSSLQDVWENQVAAYRQKYKSILGRDDSPMLTCIESALNGKPIALAVTDREQCLFSYAPAALPALLASWNAITVI